MAWVTAGCKNVHWAVDMPCKTWIQICTLPKMGFEEEEGEREEEEQEREEEKVGREREE
jgi:hypothetical protein